MKNKTEVFLLVFFAISLIVLSLYFYSDPPKAVSDEKLSGQKQELATASKKSNSTQSVAVQEAAFLNLRPEFSAYGKVVAHTKTTIHPTNAITNGRIMKVTVSPGDFVKEGDLLVEVDDTDIKRAIEKQTIQINQDKTEFQKLFKNAENLETKLDIQARTFEIEEITWSRALALYDEQVITSAELETSNQKFLNAKAALADMRHQLDTTKLNIELRKHAIDLKTIALKELEDDLKDTKIYAPFSGYILAVDTAEGSRVTGQGMLTMYDASSLEVQVDVPFRLRQKFYHRESGEIEVYFDEQLFVFDRLSSTVGAQGGNIDAFFTLPYEKLSQPYPLDDVFAVKLVLLEEPSVLLVPQLSLYENSVIYIVDKQNKLAQRQCVVLGYQFARNSLDLSQALSLVRCENVRAGDLILKTALSSVYDGMSVEILSP